MSTNSRMIIFKIANEEYAIDINQVQSIERMQPVTAMPNTSAALIGVTNIRGKVMPLFDLRIILSALPKENNDDTRIILVEFQGKSMGIVVDEANEVLEISHDNIQKPSFTVESDTFIKGVATLEKRLLILIDIEKLITNENVKGDMEHLQSFINEELPSN
ncbi:chemotaxis protein CheW [Litchfieldia salsa]|uniref:Purine-binding chemotaxis protein CheW n=1 Tax=Litchfieldia salsa TaxID=930152 RepID=A0A1H0WCF3_9BACI|nr:chemotaxis protein CheW [Litchfieldia salsa]SDP88469.1 purine-binding chemotaxis protein CheW [Litchfieldia salsa]